MQGTGDNVGAWGIILNAQTIAMIDAALDGVSVLVVNGDIVPSVANYVADETRPRVLKFTGDGGSVMLPSVSKNYLVHNTCAGAVVVRTASTAGASVAPATLTPLYCDGVDVFVSTNLWPLANGTQAVPSAYFQSDTDTGFYRVADGAFGISANGSKVFEANASGAIIVGSATISFGAIINDGTVAVPAIRFTNDSNTGIYRVGADALGIAASGSRVFEANSSGIIVPGAATLSGGAIIGDGSVTAPAIRFTSDVNTGIYRVGTDSLGVTVGGINKLQIDATGITVPAQVRAATVVLNAGSAAAPALSLSGDSDTGVYWSAANEVSFAAGGTRILNVSTAGAAVSGNIAATLSGNTALISSVTNVNAGAAATAYFAASNGTGTLQVGYRGTAQTTYGAMTAGSGFLYLNAAPLVVMADAAAGQLIFASGGNVETGRNTTTAGVTSWRFGPSTYNFPVAVANVSIGYAGGGTQYGIALRPQADTTTAIYFTNAAGTTIGSISQTAAATAYNTTSDYRLKNAIADLVGSGEFIDGLRPREWLWEEDGTRGVGFVAHEAAEITPSSVHGERDAVDADGQPVYQGMQASSPEIMANLVAEIKLLRARVSALEAA